ncbi:M1 family metallopeptidase [Chitinophaga japonensis]|nr:M1 family metallopeptidase [Chitinophaga japonensis]
MTGVGACILAYQLAFGAPRGDTLPQVAQLVHTRLDISFDYPHHLVLGKAWITLQPTQEQQDSLILDAKSMQVATVALQRDTGKQLLPFSYDGWQLRIKLDKRYSYRKAYTVYVEYTAMPDSLKTTAAGPVQTNKGIYFVSAGKDSTGQLYQVWTQGETSGASSWFPTIDQPDQRSTSEISITMPAPYISLSNGVLSSRQQHPDGSHTETWIMSDPHAPYLFMLAVGKFEKYHDSWNGMAVDYYMEPGYIAYAKEIFGRTPQMIGYFSEKIGYRFPWPKYAQIVVKDYFSGGMENTSATLFGDLLRRKPRALIGDEEAKWIIPHELFHQWFGDLVTCEQWSQLALNESFANFGEVLWGEYAYGKDAAHHHAYEAMLKYFQQCREGKDHPLIYNDYREESQLFDAVTYEKGGCILGMLRALVGEKAFFGALSNYLKVNAFKAVNANDLRTAFENETGRDLKWFWDQWFYRKGYPVLDISYRYNDLESSVAVTIRQEQEEDIFILPLKIDIYTGGETATQEIIVNRRLQTFIIPYPNKHARPLLVNVDADKQLICKKTDRKSLEAFIYQYRRGRNYLDRREALKACLLAQDTSARARAFLYTGLKDANDGLRKLVIQFMNIDNAAIRNTYAATIDSLARYDTEALVRQAAIKKLRSLNDPAYTNLFIRSLQDSSYNVVASSLIALNRLDRQLATRHMTPFLEDNEMASTILDIYLSNEDPKDNRSFLEIIARQNERQQQGYLVKYLRYLATLNDADTIAAGLEEFQRIVMGIDARFMDQPGMLGNLELLAEFKLDLIKKTASKSVRSSLEKQVASIRSAINHLSANMN